MGLARARALNRDPNIDITDVLKYYSDIRSKAMKYRCSRYICEILLNSDLHINEAEDWIKKAIETNQKYGMRWNLAQDYALYAELFKRKGAQSKAKEKLKKAIKIFKECGADGWVEKYKKELDTYL